MRFLSAAIVSALAISACAPSAQVAPEVAAASDAPDRCFRIDDIRNFSAADTTTLYVRTVRDSVYQIDSTGGCWDMDTVLALSITPMRGGFGTACVNDTVNIIVPGSTAGQGRCTGIVRKALTTEEVEALPSRVRP